ncbi:hypothetical protein QNI19_20230 [Cytophagaceae bacterium DM2B3-1]|uniref:DUF4595 domain-containing protein n=1 Tax=Xanthocytophaga flava TaxID=3048013 RepID=A0ABT7CRK6_9BACT|nr:hypothetical protein [Xanthocytophaga flavus]MDJ1467202.1 hypothetical protein [Xanthocytophaga flavus]MDJ1495279.1 hypothetical protein [Xanthocytophaga flavus]
MKKTIKSILCLSAGVLLLMTSCKDDKDPSPEAKTLIKSITNIGEYYSTYASFEYDDNGKLLSLKDSSSEDGVRFVKMVYDSEGKITSLQDKSGKEIALVEYSNGKVTKITEFFIEETWVTTYETNADGYITKKTDSEDYTRFERDSKNNITKAYFKRNSDEAERLDNEYTGFDGKNGALSGLKQIDEIICHYMWDTMIARAFVSQNATTINDYYRDAIYQFTYKYNADGYPTEATYVHTENDQALKSNATAKPSLTFEYIKK